MIKPILIIVFIGLIATFAYLVNEQTESWPELNSVITLENKTINDVTRPTIKIDTQDRSPKLSFVSATEYTKGDGNGSTIVKLIDWRGDKINTTCWETILYPDKTTYVDWTEMKQYWEYGNYYMNFVVPETLGIYDQEVRCYVSNKNISIGKGFHVGNLSGVVDSNIDELKVDRMTVMS